MAACRLPKLLLAVLPILVTGQVVSSNLPKGWMPYGCWTEATNARALNGASYVNGTSMTEESCISFCNSTSFIFAGVEYGDECYCGNAFQSGSTNTTATDCNMHCAGNSSELCGAGNRLNVFWNGKQGPPPPVTNPGFAGYSSLGCYSDSGNPRTLANGMAVIGGANNMTNDNCILACAASNYKYAGTEYSGECYCDNQIEGGATPQTSGCTMLCNGNQTEYCGGPNRLNLYLLGATSSSSSASPTSSKPASSTTLSSSIITSTSSTPISSSPTSKSTLPTSSTVSASSTGVSSSNSPSSASSKTSSTSSTSSSASPTTTATDLPTGWKYQGCWVDNVDGRILATQNADNSTMTVESCIDACVNNDYTVAGIEYSTQCFCGNAIIEGGTLASSDSQCAMTCGGNSAEICGGPNLMSIYATGSLQVLQPPAAQNTSLPTGWAYAGCVSDNANGVRALPWQLILPNNNSAANCLSQCSAYGYPYGGMEYGEECYCGDLGNLESGNSTSEPESSCNVACSGNASYICGGGNRISLYKWVGKPLYEFSYPTGNNAGSYEFFVPGLIVPLISIPTKNGKITFVEKYGTSEFDNSTGSYELDPTLVNNFELTWRTLNGIQTDVFCSAGLVLPDAAGRVINVGGWSGESTYGIRFIIPSGSLGVNGTTEWQENYNEVALQAGRWYPSAMIMANGSILVVGGETGSNAPATPSLELLPPAGPPLFCDWLDEFGGVNQDLWKVYPFLAVLPSGGILVLAWNEARILDATSLTTKTVLPTIPCSVNNPDSGRTYPFEGTSVILPQIAPYTDPITVLVCGGSGPGAEIALDNCVSIQPDAAEPQWVLERMPSQRVMTCMTALPDGTFLILNGAQHGNAGFGLGTNPNLNALLYDPTKPVGARISVMANTTIARLYHSEAVLMNDGRVLVSGSDPQDGVNPEEMRIEVFNPPYYLNAGARPSFTIANNVTSYGYGATITLHVNIPSGNAGSARVSLLGAVASTHGNSMGQRTFFPAVSCSGTTCTVTTPPNANVCPPGWFQMFLLDGPTPSVAEWVRIGGDPAGLGEWPNFPDFTRPGS